MVVVSVVVVIGDCGRNSGQSVGYGRGGQETYGKQAWRRDQQLAPDFADAPRSVGFPHTSRLPKAPPWKPVGSVTQLSQH